MFVVSRPVAGASCRVPLQVLRQCLFKASRDGNTVNVQKVERILGRSFEPFSPLSAEGATVEESGESYFLFLPPQNNWLNAAILLESPPNRTIDTILVKIRHRIRSGEGVRFHILRQLSSTFAPATQFCSPVAGSRASFPTLQNTNLINSPQILHFRCQMFLCFTVWSKGVTISSRPA